MVMFWLTDIQRKRPLSTNTNEFDVQALTSGEFNQDYSINEGFYYLIVDLVRIKNVHWY